jgi:UDP-glucose 4-epimerase
MKKIILVTGGAGFIGSHLCEELAKDKNHLVYSLDNYSSGSKENHQKNVTYFSGETKNISNIINFSPDIIYHLGEYSRVETSFKDIDIVWEYNKQGAFSVLEFVKKSGAKLIYAGSSTKFGDGELGKNQSPYAWIKSSNTELIENYGQWFDISYAIVYFYNVYGGREISTGKYATLMALFVKKYKSGKPLTVVSPGSQKRNFTHISDIISGLKLVGEKGYGNDYGIGSPDSYSILEIARMFGGEIKMLPKRNGNRMESELVTEKTKMLGWKSQISVEDYIYDLKKT